MTPDELRSLSAFLEAQDLCGRLESARPIGEGHANVTSLVTDGTRSLVVRRPPPPPLPPGANDVLREARVLAAVASAGGADRHPLMPSPTAGSVPVPAVLAVPVPAVPVPAVPVPAVLATGEAGAVFDVPFFVMEFVAGPVITTAVPPHLDAPEARRALAFDLVDRLRALHGIGWEDTGMHGRPEGSNLRQQARLARLVADDDGAAPAAFGEVDAWLVANAPPESGASLLHGDYRLGNVVVHPALPRIAAVLDWELATVGDPLVDLGYLVATWAEAPVGAGVPAPEGLDLTPIEALGSATASGGFPSKAELAERYGVTLDELRWYVVLAEWKLAVLYEYSRRQGRDPYYADPALVASFLAAARAAAGLA